MASPVMTERLASFHTLLVVLCGVLARLNGSSRHASPCLGDMHMADCRQLPCSQRSRANIRASCPHRQHQALLAAGRYTILILSISEKSCCYLILSPNGVSEGNLMDARNIFICTDDSPQDTILPTTEHAGSTQRPR